MRRRRLLVLTSYPRTAAATRFRTCAYFSALALNAIDADLRPFMDDAFMADFYRPGGRLRKVAGLARFALRRLSELLRARDYDAVFVQREAAIVGPALFETALAKGFRLPLVFDLDDAIWVKTTAASRHPIAARILKSPAKTDSLLKMASEVIASSQFVADYASRFAERVTILPTVVSRETWKPLAGRLEGEFATRDGIPTIGWIGTHSTAPHLNLVVPALQALARDGVCFRVRLVGADRTVPIDGVDVESVPWQMAAEIRDFQRIDVGIAPVHDDAFSRGKGGFKQIQYMTVGVPFASSPVGGVVEFIEHGKNALFATDAASWATQLRALLQDQALRARLARNGRDLVENRLCVEAQAGPLVHAVERAMGRRPPRLRAS